ncbi:unnamed protein product [Miscanthus lutarioriparius]|uniref:Uncharacterized protein n=1 Tax=Miscanthus lutarioriparius TaxID=422564 RepID=A0A811QGA6_9POAL|nr:unnamed protein product [Miscanthus lutarioriparius]
MGSRKITKLGQHMVRGGEIQTWTAHGERRGNQNLENGSEVEHEGFSETDRMDAMLVDLAGEHPPLDDETPTGFAESFYRMVVSADEQEMQSFNHWTDRRPRSSDFLNDVESQPPVAKRIRGRNKMLKTRNGQIVIIPEGDKPFCYANYSVDDKMKKGPILGVILKQEYLIQMLSRDGAVKKGTIIDAAKASGRRPATSRAFQNLMAIYEESVATIGRLTQQNAALVQQNATLTRDVKCNDRVLELIINQVQTEIPPDLLQEEENDMQVFCGAVVFCSSDYRLWQQPGRGYR